MSELRIRDSIVIDTETGTVKMKTNHGILIMDPFDVPDYPGFSIDFKLKGRENEPAIPVCMVEDARPDDPSEETPDNAVVVRIWGDVNQEDYTERVDIPIGDIERSYGYKEIFVCPKCGKGSSEWAWNHATAECYGDELTGIVPLKHNAVYKITGKSARSLYKCPKCGEEEIKGADIKVKR